MKKLLLLLVLLISISGFKLYSQNDTINKVSNIQYLNDAKHTQNEYILNTEIEQQKLYKNLFMIGFIFMLLFVLLVIYIYHSKIKEISKFISTQATESTSEKYQIKILSMILNNVNNSVSLVAKNGEIMWLNHAFTSLFGYSLETINEKKDFPVLNNYLDKEIQSLVDKGINEKVQVLFVDKFTNEFGKKVDFQRKIIPIIDTNQEIANFVIIDSEMAK